MSKIQGVSTDEDLYIASHYNVKAGLTNAREVDSWAKVLGVTVWQDLDFYAEEIGKKKQLAPTD